MSIVIGILTVLLVLNCLLLMLFILIQLPKKEAGAGLAFGAGATDALFGAGSGNALTKMTKYATVVFFVLSLMLSILTQYQQRSGSRQFRDSLDQPVAGTPAPKPAPATATTPAAVPTNLLISTPAVTNPAPAPSPAATTNPPGR